MQTLQEIIDSSNHSPDEYNPFGSWTFGEGRDPFDWFDAQVKAINHFGHIFCYNPFYNNFNKFTLDGKYLRPPNSPDIFYGYQFDSTEKLLKSINTDYLNMHCKTILYLKLNFNIDFPNGWSNQFKDINVSLFF